MKQVWTKITCLNCKKELIQIKETYLNPNVEKDLKNKILHDEYFVEICPHCHHRIPTIYPCIYKDSTKHLLIYLKEMAKVDVENYHQRYVTTIADFKELVQIYEDQLEDQKILSLKNKLKRYCNKTRKVKQIHYQGLENHYLFFEVDQQIMAISYEQYQALSCEEESFSKIIPWGN